jgi:hypothetical protein
LISQQLESPGSLLVKVTIKAPNFNSSSAFLEILYISSGAKQVELASTNEASLQLSFKKSPFTNSISGKPWKLGKTSSNSFNIY